MDSLYLKSGLNGFSSSVSYSGGIESRKQTAHVSCLGRSAGGGVSTHPNEISLEKATATAPLQKSSSSRFSFVDPLRSLWPGGGNENGGKALDDALVVDGNEEGGGEEEEAGTEVEDNEPVRSEERRGNWVLKILHIRSLWNEKGGKGGVDVLEREEKKDEDGVGCSCCDNEESEVSGVDEEEEVMEFDRDSFSRLLRRVSLAEAKLYAQMSYLGTLTYSIPKIKPGNLLKYQGLRLVTSSVEKKAQSMNAEKEQTSAQVQGTEEMPEEAKEEEKQTKKTGYRISASAAYKIAASAASYLQSHTKSILPFKPSKDEKGEESPESGSGTNENAEMMSSEVASFVATTNSLTAVVAAKEEMKQAVAKDLNSVHSSPCEWFICDDDQSGTRFFVIQGSESLASWQANLLFEPIQFEGLDVLVHRGIYEAAKGIYEQMLPEVHAHLKSRGDSATFRFTGHSLGGSLSLLVNLMLSIRGEVPLASLLPVITFGAPSIMCGGDQLLRRLGLPRNHVQAVTMHRDIVPRAFSCNYPDHVAELLKAVNGNFRNHPCLKNQKLLYAPMGVTLILQPNAKHSPQHHLLPSGNGLYFLSGPVSESGDSEKLIRTALTVFLNSPHPLEILSDRSAYGSGGAIYRDHDMKSYLRSVRGVICQELIRIRKAEREQRRRVWWSLITPRGIQSGVVVHRRVVSSNVIQQEELGFSGVIRTGKESLMRFSRLVASQHMHLLLLLIIPIRLLFLGVYNIISFR